MVQIKKLNKKELNNFKTIFSKEFKKYDLSIGINPDVKEYFFIALENKKVLGYFKCKIWGNASYLSHLLVFSKIRRTGIGQKLIETYENFSKKQKCHVCYLETSEKHTLAIKFYEKNSYKKIAILKNNKFNLDWYFYEKRLK